MSVEQARAVADAVLYEGYVLYPYRAGSGKNRVRWQFGVVGPRDTSGEDPLMRTECLVEAREGTTVDVRVRFLHVQARTAEQATGSGEFTPVAELRAGADIWVTWDEAVEREVIAGEIDLAALGDGMQEIAVEVSGGEEVETVAGAAGRVVRRRLPLTGVVRLAAETVDGLVKLRVEVENRTDPVPGARREEAVRRSFVAVHTLLEVHGGAFVSLLDPPPEARAAAASCANHRTWPVLIGQPGDRSVLLSSPIILYDYPEVAPESPGDLFDATEIDELLTLRVMTLTDEEKVAARATDARAAAIVDRSDSMPPEVFERLHGAVRYLGETPPPSFTPEAPWWDPGVDASVSPREDAVTIAGVPVRRGSRVLLRPRRRADAQDLFYAGRQATVAAVNIDVDDEVHLAVTIDDDPARDLHDWYGRYLYFAPEEVEPLEAAMSDPDSNRTMTPAEDEEAHPFEEPITATEEPQEARGARGSRDKGSDLSDLKGTTPERRQAEIPADPEDSTGVNPQGPIDEDSPYLQPGDQGG